MHAAVAGEMGLRSIIVRLAPVKRDKSNVELPARSPLDFRDPFRNRVQVVQYDQIQIRQVAASARRNRPPRSGRPRRRWPSSGPRGSLDRWHRSTVSACFENGQRTAGTRRVHQAGHVRYPRASEVSSEVSICRNNVVASARLRPRVPLLNLHVRRGSTVRVRQRA